MWKIPWDFLQPSSKVHLQRKWIFLSSLSLFSTNKCKQQIGLSMNPLESTSLSPSLLYKWTLTSNKWWLWHQVWTNPSPGCTINGFTGAICAQNDELTFRSETNWRVIVAPSLWHVMVSAICAQNHELTFRSETNWWTTVAPSLWHVMVSAAMHLAIDWNDCLCTASPPCDWVGL